MKKKLLFILLAFFLVIGGTACGKLNSEDIEENSFEEQLQILRSDMKLTQEQVMSKIKAEYLIKNNGYLDTDEIDAIITLSEGTLIDTYLSRYANTLQSVATYAATDQGQNQVGDLLEKQNLLIEELYAKNLIKSVEYQYTTILNAISVKTTYGDFKKIEELENVSSTILSDTYNLPQSTSTDTSAILNLVDVYETGIFNSSTVQYTGKGTAVAVLDSGFDISHTVFANQPDVTMISKDDVALALPNTKAATFTKNIKISDVYYSEKIPFVYDYADKDPDVFPYDSNHGTHVAGIIGGQDDKITGVAVNTQLVLLKVFPDLSEGGRTDDILAALEDAVLLNVDAINMSLGASCGFAREKDGDAINDVYDKINESGISLLTAASNSYSSGFGGEHGNTNFATNPDSGTIGSPSTYAAALSVASISGVKSSYIVGNDSQVFFFKESNSITGKENNFIEELGLKPGAGKDYEYVTIPGVGKRVNYGGLGDLTGKIALVRRGETTFEDKALQAKNAGALACIIYNNIDGDISMSMGKTDHIPTVSISKEDGTILAKQETGTLRISYDQQAGPFMSDFSSWGPLPSLEMKPEITAHGGNITSAVPGGGYDQISGTSMATPNLCGIVVLIRQHLKELYPESTWKEISVMANELLMSTATIIKNKDGNPYSPRKQGAGLASLYNAVNTEAYITIEGKDRTKLELFDDSEKTGIYTMTFDVVNTANKKLNYDVSVIGMTESVSKVDESHVAEKSKLLAGSTSINVLSGGSLNGTKVSINANGIARLEVVYKLTAEDKNYIDSLFPYGMYVEGFVRLVGEEEEQIDLNVPFLGFYGDWTLAPMFDKTYYEVESEAHNMAIDDEDRIKADYYATTPFGTYFYNYMIPLGTYLYTVDSNKYDPIPASEDKIAISNTLGAIDGLSTVLAGLLRGAKTMDYTIVDKITGEVIYEFEAYNMRKAFSNGGAPFPAYEFLNLKPNQLGLQNNREYEFKMTGLLDYKDGGLNSNTRNSFSFDFTLDDEAPVLKDVKYEKVYDRTLKKDRYYMTMTIYDNQYVHSITPIIFTSSSSYTFLTDNPIPVYSEKGKDNVVRFEITDFLNDTNTDASLITSSLAFSIDDYALNSSIYFCELPGTKGEFRFTKDGTEDGSDLQILSIYEDEIVDLTKYLVTKDSSVDAEKDYLKYLDWSSSNENIVVIKNGQVRGIKSGRATIIVREMMDLKQAVLIINVKERPSEATTNNLVLKPQSYKMETKSTSASNARLESIRFSYFETLFAYSRAAQTSEIGRTGSKNFLSSLPGGSSDPSLSFYPGEKIQLFHDLFPWYVEDNLELTYKSYNPDVASVDENGVVTALKRGNATIELGVKGSNLVAKLAVSVKSEFIIENRTLIAYKGLGGEVVIPDDEGILFIGSYAFSLYETDNTIELTEEDYDANKIPSMNTTITSVIIPEGVEEIQRYAFFNSSGLKSVTLPDSIRVIREFAFGRNIALKTINLSNIEVIGREAFAGCGELNNIDLSKIYAIGVSAFEGCTSLEKVDLTTLRNTGRRAFKDCTSLDEVILSENTKLAAEMFVNSGLKTIDIYEKVQIPDYCFAKSENLVTVNIHNDLVSIGKGAFSECTSLEEVNLNANIARIDDQAFYACESLVKFVLPNNQVELGSFVFYECSQLEEIEFLENTEILEISGSVFGSTNLSRFVVADTNKNYASDDYLLVSKDGKTIILAATARDYGDFVLDAKYERVFDSAFAGVDLTSLTITNPNLVIGDYAFSYIESLNIINLPETTGVMIGNHAFYYSESLGEVNNLNKVKHVGDYAFANSAITEVEIASEAVYGEGVFFRSKLVEVTIGEGSIFGIGAFQNTGSLVKVNMPEGGNVHFGVAAFANATKLEVIDLSKVGSVIEEQTFYGCSSLKVANLENVEYIGDYAFADCRNLVTLNMPIVIEIGEGAFSSNATSSTAPQFNDLVLPNTLEKIGDGAFLGCRGIGEVILPDSLISIGDYVFAFCINLHTVVLPTNITTLGRYIFTGNSSLTSINLGHVEEVGEYAFTSAGLLENVDLSSAKIIGEGAFAATGLTGEHTLNQLTKVEEYAFQNTKFFKFDAPNLEEIGIAAFQFNENLTKFLLNDKLTSIGYMAFHGCKNLETFYYLVDNKEVKDGQINDYALLENSILYTKLDTGYLELASVPSALKRDSLVVLDGTTRIDIYAGNENQNVKKIVLPDSLKSIGGYAFFNYKNLEEVEFKSFTAPVLETNTNYSQELQETDPGYDIIHKNFNIFYSQLYYFNFVEMLGKKKPLKMTLPKNTNLIGYDSLVYLVYFGSVEDAGRSNYEAMHKNMDDFIYYAKAVMEIEVITLGDEKLINNALTSYNGINQDPTNYGYTLEEWNAMIDAVREAKSIHNNLKINYSTKNLKGLQVRINELPKTFNISQLEILRDIAAEVNALKLDERALLDLENYNSILASYQDYIKGITEEVEPVISTVSNRTRLVGYIISPLFALGVVFILRRRWVGK